MKTLKILGLGIMLTTLAGQGQAFAQTAGFPRMNMDSLNALTGADHAEMLRKIGVVNLRPGKDGYSKDPVIGANYDEFSANPYLDYPDPLVTFDGRTVRNVKMWEKVRRPELLEVFEEQFYGRIPDNVPSVEWKVVKEEPVMQGSVKCIQRTLEGVVDNSSYPEISVIIQADVVWPESAGKNIPVIVEYGFSTGNFNFAMPGVPAARSWKEQVVERGWAAATLVPTSFQADGGHGLRNGIIGLCNKGGSRSPEDWGSIRAWVWGLSRLIDYFEADSQFDGTKVAIEGNSRYGKTALASAAFDQRVAAAFVSSSGKGGAAPWRRNCGETVENLAASGEYHWMCGNFIKWAADSHNASEMPVDQHELIGLCAPRAVFISSGTFEADHWQDLMGMYLSTCQATPVYELYGLKGMSTWLYPGTNVGIIDGPLAFRQHDGGHTPGPNWPYFLDFFDRFVVNTGI